MKLILTMLVVVYSDCWKDHLSRLRKVLRVFADVDLTVNLAKSEFGHAEVNFWDM